MSLRKIQRLVNVVNTNLHTFEGKLSYSRIIEGIVRLANTVKEFEGETESIWSIGESLECLDDILIGAYWHCVHWHGGQASQLYAAQCSIGNVYSPGMGGDETESMTYANLESLAERIAIDD